MYFEEIWCLNFSTLNKMSHPIYTYIVKFIWEETYYNKVKSLS